MAAAKRGITNVAQLADYLSKKGDLHDCVVDLFQWQPISHCIEIKLLDANANLRDLPEYKGVMPCTLKFKGVVDINFFISGLSEKLKIYETELSLVGRISSLKMLFSPTGGISFSFAELEILDLG